MKITTRKIWGLLKWHAYDKHQPSPFQRHTVRKSGGMACHFCGRLFHQGEEVWLHAEHGAAVHTDCLFQRVHDLAQVPDRTNASGSTTSA